MKKSLFYTMFMMGLLMALPSHAIQYPSYKPTYRSVGYIITSSKTRKEMNLSVAVAEPVTNYEAAIGTPFDNRFPEHSWDVSVSAMNNDNSAPAASRGPRRAWGGDDDDEDDDDDTEDGNLSSDITTGTENPDSPIGSLPLLLMLLLCGAYAVVKKRQQSKLA